MVSVDFGSPAQSFTADFTDWSGIGAGAFRFKAYVAIKITPTSRTPLEFTKVSLPEIEGRRVLLSLLEYYQELYGLNI